MKKVIDVISIIEIICFGLAILGCAIATGIMLSPGYTWTSIQIDSLPENSPINWFLKYYQLIFTYVVIVSCQIGIVFTIILRVKLKTNKKIVALGILNIIFGSAPVGILYLCWKPETTQVIEEKNKSL